jgi:hypothetical protein
VDIDGVVGGRTALLKDLNIASESFGYSQEGIEEIGSGYSAGARAGDENSTRTQATHGKVVQSMVSSQRPWTFVSRPGEFWVI